MTRALYLSRCLCGLRAQLHFAGPGMKGRKLTCQEAREQHQRATERPETLSAMLRRSLEAAQGSILCPVAGQPSKVA